MMPSAIMSSMIVTRIKVFAAARWLSMLVSLSVEDVEGIDPSVKRRADSRAIARGYVVEHEPAVAREYNGCDGSGARGIEAASAKRAREKRQPVVDGAFQETRKSRRIAHRQGIGFKKE